MPHQLRDESTLDGPRVAGAGRALGVGCAWLWSCRGARCHAQKYLAQANRHIAELTVQAARQRVMVKDALDAGQRSEMAESLLDALEGSLRIFEKHRIFLLSCNVNRSE